MIEKIYETLTMITTFKKNIDRLVTVKKPLSVTRFTSVNDHLGIAGLVSISHVHEINLIAKSRKLQINLDKPHR